MRQCFVSLPSFILSQNLIIKTICIRVLNPFLLLATESSPYRSPMLDVGLSNFGKDINVYRLYSPNFKFKI